MGLSTETTARMISASQEAARRLGIAISTAIIDPEGRLAAFSRMPEAHWISIEAAQAKALTAAMLRRDGPDLAKLPEGMVAALGEVHGRALMAAGSVTALLEDGRLVAGIGCSGGMDAQDAECAHAARDAYLELAHGG